jgi:hypothetical protein
MQDLHARHHLSSSTCTTDTPDGVLEDSGSLILNPNGEVVRFGPHVVGPEKKNLGELQWWHVRLAYPTWTKTAARYLAQGGHVSVLLSPTYHLIDGKHRPAWHPRPGVDLAELAYVPWPPDDISATELMMRLVASVRG